MIYWVYFNSEFFWIQATFVCTRTDSSIPCEESEKYYILNEELGKVDEEEGNELDKPSRRDPDADLISRPYQLKSKSPRVNEKIIRKIKWKVKRMLRISDEITKKFYET